MRISSHIHLMPSFIQSGLANDITINMRERIVKNIVIALAIATKNRLSVFMKIWYRKSQFLQSNKWVSGDKLLTNCEFSYNIFINEYCLCIGNSLFEKIQKKLHNKIEMQIGESFDLSLLYQYELQQSWVHRNIVQMKNFEHNSITFLRNYSQNHSDRLDNWGFLFDKINILHSIQYMKAILSSLLVLIILPISGGIWA